MNFRTMALATAAAFTLATGAASAATFNVTKEAPGVQNSTAAFSSSGVENFNGQAVGAGQSFVSHFNTGTVITGSYSNVDIRAADQFGGAGGNTNFASTSSSGGYSLTLSTTDPAGINYFGFWLSALDSGNQLTFYNGATQVFAFSPGDVTALGLASSYYGNPNAPFSGNNSGQPYVFLNFFDTVGTFDKVVFSENPGVGGYESDNHTVGFFTSQSGTPLGGVPEPATWGLLLLGIGSVGAVLRRERQARAATCA